MNNTHHPTSSISIHNLPLAVREHLMRNQHQHAIDCLVNDYHIEKTVAHQLIDDYRQELRERKIALEVQIMNETNEREKQAQVQTAIVWGARFLVLLFVLILLYLVTKTNA